MKKEKEERRKSKGARKKKQFNNGKERARSMAVKSQQHISSKSHTSTSQQPHILKLWVLEEKRGG